MTALSAIKTVLEADATLLATATGGVWDYDETDRQGINRTTAPAAFDANKVIKPCVLLVLRSATPDRALEDYDRQVASVREVVEVWLYQDKGYTAIETMGLRIYALLHLKTLPGTFQVSWQGFIRAGRDIGIDANLERNDYLAVTMRQV